VKNEEGETVTLTSATYVPLLMSSDRRVRRSAFHTMYKTYHQFGNTLSALLGARVREKVTMAKLRRFPDSLSASVFSDEVTTDVYMTLIRTVREGLAPLFDYYDLKREVLGVRKLHLYDVYAPLCGEAAGTYTYPEAVEEVLRTTQYGKCVFKCNNNVVDHQVVNLEFEDEVCVSFTMSAFNLGGRAIRIMGTKGEIDAKMKNNEIRIYNFESGKWRDCDCNSAVAGDSITSGHGGGDFITARTFLECIEEGHQPEHPFNIKAAIAMSSVAILAHRSALEGGKTYDIPDFSDEKWCKMYENDRLTPFWGTDGSAPTLPCCTVNDFEPTAKQLELYHESLK
jgi:hypothetical protein